MRLTIKEPEINIGTDGFKGHCRLDRTSTGKKLSELVEKIEDPIVIALDGSWGSGKSFFLKCWTGAHAKENDGKAKVIYFDAFQHDFLDDPLIALTGVLSDQFDPKSKAGKAIGLAKKAVSKMWRPAARIGLAAATVGASEIAGAVGDAAIATASGELSKASENFWKKEDGRRAAMGEFRTALEKLTEPDEEGTPQKIVIIIDELDRCRPDYALTMLEVIKHFFAVDNVLFVLGVNLTELENSVKARYGTGIDAERYLQKFIHLRMELPNRVGTGAEFDAIPITYLSTLATELSLPNDLVKIIRYYLRISQGGLNLSLRSVQRLSSILALIPRNLENKVQGYKYVVAGAAIIKAFSPELYSSLLNGDATMVQIDKFFKFASQRKNTGNAAEQFRLSWLAFMDFDEYQQKNQKFSNLFHNTEYDYGDDWLIRTLNDLLETFELLEEPPQQ